MKMEKKSQSRGLSKQPKGKVVYLRGGMGEREGEEGGVWRIRFGTHHNSGKFLAPLPGVAHFFV